MLQAFNFPGVNKSLKYKENMDRITPVYSAVFFGLTFKFYYYSLKHLSIVVMKGNFLGVLFRWPIYRSGFYLYDSCIVLALQDETDGVISKNYTNGTRLLASDWSAAL